MVAGSVRVLVDGFMGIRETHTLTGKSINIRGGDLRFRIVATRIAVAHVIRENDHDIRLLLGSADHGEGKYSHKNSNQGRHVLMGFGWAVKGAYLASGKPLARSSCNSSRIATRSGFPL